MDRREPAEMTSREAEIADELFTSKRTVESHVSSLLRKLGASRRRQLAGLAMNLLPTRGTRSSTATTPTPASTE